MQHRVLVNLFGATATMGESECFEQFFRSSSGAQKLYMQHPVLVNLFGEAVNMDESFSLTHASGRTKQVDKYPMLHVQFLSS